MIHRRQPFGLIFVSLRYRSHPLTHTKSKLVQTTTTKNFFAHLPLPVVYLPACFSKGEQHWCSDTIGKSEHRDFFSLSLFSPKREKRDFNEEDKKKKRRSICEQLQVSLHYFLYTHAHAPSTQHPFQEKQEFHISTFDICFLFTKYTGYWFTHTHPVSGIACSAQSLSKVSLSRLPKETLLFPFNFFFFTPSVPLSFSCVCFCVFLESWYFCVSLPFLGAQERKSRRRVSGFHQATTGETTNTHTHIDWGVGNDSPKCSHAVLNPSLSLFSPFSFFSFCCVLRAGGVAISAVSSCSPLWSSFVPS